MTITPRQARKALLTVARKIDTGKLVPRVRKPYRNVEVTIEREDGERDTLHLCDDCRTSITDYARTISIRDSSSSCDRCGRKSGDKDSPQSPQHEREAKIAKRQAQVARLERKIKALTTRLKKARRSLVALERAKLRHPREILVRERIAAVPAVPLIAGAKRVPVASVAVGGRNER